MRKTIAVVLVLGLAGTFALADYVVRGDFNNWGNAPGVDLPMVDMGGGMYSGTATGLTAGQSTEYKCTTPDWSFNAPGSNGKIVANAAGEITFNFYPATSWADGWKPDNVARVGYADPHQFGWEIIGSFDGWAGGYLALSDMGNGLYYGQTALNAGDYEFKFRKAGDWAISIGGDFGNSAGNIALNVANTGDIIGFSLDLPNGRWKTEVIPEPASIACLALLGLLIRRR